MSDDSAQNHTREISPGNHYYDPNAEVLAKTKAENEALRAQIAELQAELPAPQSDLAAQVAAAVAQALGEREKPAEQPQGFHIRNLRDTPVSLTLDDEDGGKPFRIRLKPRGKVGDATYVTPKFVNHHRLVHCIGQLVEVVTLTEAKGPREPAGFKPKQVDVHVQRKDDRVIRRIAIERMEDAPKGGKVVYGEDSGTSRAHMREVAPVGEPPVPGSEARAVLSADEHAAQDLTIQKLVRDGVMPPLKPTRINRR